MGVLLLVSVTLAGPAASGESKRQQATALYKAGNQLYSKGDYAAALVRFREAYALFPSYKIDYNIAVSLEALGRHAEAAEGYERFLKQGKARSPRSIRRTARSSLAALRKRLASLALSCTVAGARVKIGQREVGQTPLLHRIYLRPGKYRLVVGKPGYQPFFFDLAPRAGERRELQVLLRETAIKPQPAPPAPAPTPAPEPAPASQPARAAPEQVKPAPAPVAAVQTRPDDSLARQHRTKTIWGYATLGVGLALAVSAAVTYGVGASQGAEAQDSYLQATELRPVASEEQIVSVERDKEAARTKIVVGHLLAGTAAVALGLSIYQFLTRPLLARPQASSAGVSLVPTAGGASLSLSGSF